MKVASYAEIMGRYPWRPIPRCPGRYVMKSGPSPLSPGVVAGAEPTIFHVDTAPDPVFVVPLPDGGLISYKKGSGFYIHTLCDSEGFSRKLEALGISIP